MTRFTLSRRRFLARVGVLPLFFLPFLGGCSRKRGDVTHFDAAQAAAAAMAAYDSNHDGYLDAKELERCPGLKSVLDQFDKDKDRRLSQAEIEEGLAAMQEHLIDLTDVTCKVTLDKRPLVGASVVLEPESFLQASLKPATATTNEKGRGLGFQVEGQSRPGCQVGLYRVRITKQEGGRELIPARYNANTQLGLGVGPGLAPRGTGVYNFHLTSS